ncbi:uncharacterized protein LOC126365994 [Schistocerca gregaria]|uniref:uncharacterized protein LOC126365994 n=1 Tax=Schistocerca gregaria TaxID=7010 RepID=UPI00211EEE14|nr:uncharacterized protein LOC126365994 [Schistocerca gregaria]
MLPPAVSSMKMTQVGNTGMKNWKKRKLKSSGSTVKTIKLDNKFADKPLHGNNNKRIKFNCGKSEIRSVGEGPDKATDKCFDSHSKKKLHNCSKTSGNVINTVTSVASAKAADFNISESNVENYQGTNGSGMTIKKHVVESQKKSSNLTSEKNILLTRIERKAVCSNWKLFKEVIGKNESSTGQVPRFKRKKPFDHAHKAEIKTHTKISDKSTNSQRIVMPLKNEKDDMRSGQINGQLSQKEKASKNAPIHGKMKKHHSESTTNGKWDNSADVKNAAEQFTSVTAPHNSNRLTKEIALDCEMVGTDDKTDMVARVSLVNKFGDCVYDKYVAPTEKVHDYRTWVSGIRPENLKNAEDFKQVQKEVAELLRGRLLVGHALRNDLKVLYLSHPRRYTRDTQRFKLFRELAKTKRPSLKKLAAAVLNVNIQEGEHSSVEDARVAMQLYMIYQKKWEKLFKKSRRKLASKDITVSSE